MNRVITQLLRDLESNLAGHDLQYFMFGLPEDGLSEDMALKGVLTINPISTAISAITTGIQDEDRFTLDISVHKMLRGYPKNGNKETGAEFMTRIMEGRDNDGNLNTNTVRQVVRRNLRTYGLRQDNIQITYNTNSFENEGLVSAALSITVIGHTNQTIN